MLKNSMPGILISFDGPNGAGKSTIIQQLSDKFIKNGTELKVTNEPTRTMLGKFTKKQSEYIKGNALACLVAADRYEHLKNEIIPELEAGKVVLCDRYILSSFILQGMDNVDLDFINSLNSKVISPDIQIALYTSVDVIQNRLNEREVFSRFEKNNQTDLEIKYLNKGIEYLEKQNISVYRFDTAIDIKSNVEKIYTTINAYINKRR